MKWDIVREKKRLVFCETTIWGGEQREAWGSAPNSGLIFLLFLSYQWLDQAWWMTEGCREGWGVDKTCSQSHPSPHNVRKTRDCCVWATEGGGCTGTEHEGARGAVHGQCSETEMYREGGLRPELVAFGGFTADIQPQWICMFVFSLAQRMVLRGN